MLPLLLAAVLADPGLALDNAYVRVSRDLLTCPVAAATECGDRVIVALGAVELGVGEDRLALERGDVVVFAAAEDRRLDAAGSYFEVVIKPGHPPALPPLETIPAEKNSIRHDGAGFFVFEEKLAPGDIRARHSHSQRVVIQLNRTRLRQWPDGAGEIVVEIVPERPVFSPPVIHKVENIGQLPLRGIVIEFKP